MLTLAVSLAVSIAAAPTDTDPLEGVVVVAVPFGADTPSRALAEAVAGALPRAAADRGLGSTRSERVKPVDEALRACRDDICRVTHARRLGARLAVLGSVTDDGLFLRLVDLANAGAVRAQTRVDGAPPAVLARAPDAVDALLEAVAPIAAHRIGVAIDALDEAVAAHDHVEAAQVCLALATLEPDARGAWLFRAAEELDEAGRADESRAQFLLVAADPTVADEVRVEALARSRVP